jgi:hypothetical protein
VAIAALGTAERLLVNNGSGVFTYNAALITSFVDSSMDGEFADLDNDNDLDYVSGVGESGAFQNRIYMNVGGVADNKVPTFRLQTHGPSTVAGAIPVRVAIKDIMATDNDPDYTSVTLSYDVNGLVGMTPMKWAGADFFRGVIPFAAVGQTVMYSVTAVDRAGNSATSATITFSPGVPPGNPSLSIATPGLGALTVNIYSPATPSAEEFLFVSLNTTGAVGSGPFFGLAVDAFNIVFLPVGLPPLHDYLNAGGLQVSAFGPGALPPGFAFDARAVLIVAPAPIWTNLLRVTIL